MKNPVTFYSEGLRLVGDVYYPAALRPGEKRAGVVLLGSGGGTVLLVRDEVIFLPRDLLQEDQLAAGQVEGDTPRFGHPSTSLITDRGPRRRGS